jgi:hypothetical protein
MRDLYLYRSVHHYTPSMPLQLAREGEGRCIVPSDLHHHWQFLGPCCLCLLGLGKQSGYKESATFMAIGECHTGEYMASCAMQECLYFGELSIHYFDYMSWLNWIATLSPYSKGNILVRWYNLRGKSYCKFYLSQLSDLCITGNGEPWSWKVLHLSKQQSIVYDNRSDIPFMHPTASD